MTAKKNPVVLSPLADPVVGAIFSDAQNAGLAAASLIGAVLEKDGIFIREVVSVTPQRHHKEPGSRGVRIDVEVATEADEVIIVEVQLFPDDSLYQRNLFAASHVFIDRVPEGTQPRDLAASM
ncbi:MAG: Rpn family recombination-promoting nuclease/putative transposase, partial [Treponema sp.]|nr:Rpn family recombination-promoting nuclease/putative transposase [Treponema sp.]